MINLLFADDGANSNFSESLKGIPDLNQAFASDSKNVLEILKIKRPEIIILGNLQVGINRDILTRILKNDADTASITILFIEISKEDTELMLNAGGDAPLKMPLDIEALKTTLTGFSNNRI